MSQSPYGLGMAGLLAFLFVALFASRRPRDGIYQIGRIFISPTSIAMRSFIRVPLFLLLFCLSVFHSCREASPMKISSPDGDVVVEFALDDSGVPGYLVNFRQKAVIKRSSLGFELEGQPPLASGFRTLGVRTDSFEQTWPMPWGEDAQVINRYNEMVVELQQGDSDGRSMNIHLRAYDDGFAFRYELLPMEGIDTLRITNEMSMFRLTGDHTCWWLPGDWDSYELLYNTDPFSKIDAIAKRKPPGVAASYIPENAVNTPVTMKTADGLYLSFHEANLTDYAGMTLKVDTDSLSMVSSLVGSRRANYKVRRALPFSTPWRSVIISEDAAGLIDSRLNLNLNEPNRLGDVSWFKPKKYVGIWWEMHLGASTWDYESSQSMNNQIGVESAESSHGATTENAKRYIDFASENEITGILVEGWNTGWDKWFGIKDREGIFDFTTPYPDYDLQEVVRYAKEKGVEVIMHHETSAAPRTYEKRMDAAFDLMESLDIHSVKSGYVGPIQPEGEYHHGQWMVNHYRKALIKAGEKKIAINAHEPIKATGIRRTYPNAIAREGLRGQEYNAWSPDGGNPPEHIPIVAFTRMLAGPIDFTPGVFNIKLKPYRPDSTQVNTTLAKQLALYVVIYSPIQMACDLPENYQGQPAFQFIRDVGVDWERSITLGGEVGDFVTIAREERGSGDWFVGSVTDENGREISITFDFLDQDVEYQASIYRDGQGAHWDSNPLALEIEQTKIKKGDERSFGLAPGGGLAISLLKSSQ